MKKLMIASDIHGSALWCGKLLERFAEEGADSLLLLGDLLYHGPRNNLPDEYAPQKVFAMFNAMREKLLCVRGNCDGEVDQMVLEFPIMAEYAVLLLNGLTVYATHGHRYNGQTPPPFASAGILLYGHTHVPVCTPREGFVAMNPGSVSLPKQGSRHSYMTWEKGLFLWKSVESGESYREFVVEGA
ncbi:phosphodiesterase [Mailhella massiliensis]|uniref:Phosphoesterase n=1 Tax=Mailhella massiliensis TaxID=1903261 RepID=A0A921DTF3_9BACT|nr:phosphodiesterase [Mailhella massiliensis]HJD98027.1 phosphodiesterase [Mailhella massiliensis]